MEAFIGPMHACATGDCGHDQPNRCIPELVRELSLGEAALNALKEAIRSQDAEPGEYEPFKTWSEIAIDYAEEIQRRLAAEHALAAARAENERLAREAAERGDYFDLPIKERNALRTDLAAVRAEADAIYAAAQRANQERLNELDAARAEAERVKAALSDAIESVESVPARCAGTSMIHSPQIGERQVARWKSALSGEAGR